MTNPAKLYAKLLDDPGATIAFRDFERMLRAFGFSLDRSKGSHWQYRHPAIGRAFPVQPSGSDAKRYQVRQFLDLIEVYGLHIDE